MRVSQYIASAFLMLSIFIAAAEAEAAVIETAGVEATGSTGAAGLEAAGSEAAGADTSEIDYAAADPIVITGKREFYDAPSIRAGTKTDTDIKDIPQAITVITAQQIADQALLSVADVLAYVPGAASGTGEGNRDQITLRGNNSTADFFVDGIRDDVQYYRDFYNADRVEILKGPNAMIFGRGGGGGVVNRVTKRSSLMPSRAFSTAVDSEGGYRLTADIDQPLSASAGLRVNSVYENGESFREQVGLERYAINPTIGFALSGDTRIDLAYEYLHDRRTTDRGVPADGSLPLAGFRRFFFGNPALSFAKADVYSGTFAIEHRFSEKLSIRNLTQYADYDKFYQNVYPSDFMEGTRQVRLAAYNDSTRRKNLFSQTDLQWDSRLGGVEQTLLLGFELGRQNNRNRHNNGFFQPSDSASLVLPVGETQSMAEVIFRPVNTDPGRTPANYNSTKANVAALYVQDQLHLSSQFEIITGLRFDRFELGADNLNTSQHFSRTDTLFSPRLGLIVKPIPALSLYASYSRSYLPSAGDQFGSLNLVSAALKPERFDNYEIGAKWEPRHGLLATAALYQLDRTNTRAPGPNPGEIVLTGAQRSKGLELGLQGNITTKWRVSAGYALQQAKIVHTTAAAPAGREVPLVPRHQFSLWNRYDVKSNLGLGLGIIARSKTFASISNHVTLPGYVRADAAIFYQIAQGVEAQINIENILGARYFATAHNDNNIAPGAPITARATLRLGF